jgi:hypothetical protein
MQKIVLKKQLDTKDQLFKKQNKTSLKDGRTPKKVLQMLTILLLRKLAK